MSAFENIPQSNNPHNIDPTDTVAWLQSKIEYYQAEVTRLEAQLKHYRTLLRGHQTWLADVEREKVKNGS